MFAASLVGIEGWYSTKCRLTWKLVGTKSSRLYFQLAVSTLPTEGIGFGLLPTPKATEIEEDYDQWKERMIASGNPKNVGKTTANIGTMARSGLLPTPKLLKTPCAMDAYSGNLSKVEQKMGNSGTLAQEILSGFAQRERGLLPTPASRDVKGANSMEHLSRKDKSEGNSHQDQLPNFIKLVTGETSQLNPRFVLEMMGFPPDWTELPFQSGETNQSKQPETP
jgi:hypothetical protein